MTKWTRTAQVRCDRCPLILTTEGSLKEFVVSDEDEMSVDEELEENSSDPREFEVGKKTELRNEGLDMANIMPGKRIRKPSTRFTPD